MFPLYFPVKAITICVMIARGLLVPLQLPPLFIPGGPSLPTMAYVQIDDIRINEGDRPEDPDLIDIRLVEWRDGAGCTHTFIRVAGQTIPCTFCPVTDSEGQILR